MSFTNQEMIGSLGGWIFPLTGRGPYNKKNVDEAIQNSSKILGALEQHLLIHTFLVGERITLADLFAAGLISIAFRTVSFGHSRFILQTFESSWIVPLAIQEMA